MHKTAFLVFVVVGIACAGPPPPTRTARARLPTVRTTARPPAPGPANLTLACRAPHPTCEDPGFDMSVLGDRVGSCLVQAEGTAIRLVLESSNDASSIVVAFDGYHGPATYSLDQPGTRFVSVDDSVDFAGCGGPINLGKRVSAADPNCGSPACSVRVDDVAAAAAFPKTLTFTVHCTSLCENGGDATCSGPIDFITRTTCSS